MQRLLYEKIRRLLRGQRRRCRYTGPRASCRAEREREKTEGEEVKTRSGRIRGQRIRRQRCGAASVLLLDEDEEAKDNKTQQREADVLFIMHYSAFIIYTFHAQQGESPNRPRWEGARKCVCVHVISHTSWHVTKKKFKM